jgi:thiol-disulfide isomerase/thioredoxin
LRGGQVIPADAKTVLKSVRKPGAKAVLLNVWATWCEPCREEMPDIVRFYRENQQRGLRLVLVSGDSIEEKASVEKFLSEQGVHFPTFIKTGSDMDFIDGIDSRWNGDLPVSLLFDAQGNRVHFWSGKVAFEVLQQSFEHLIQTGAKGPKNRRLE